MTLTDCCSGYVRDYVDPTLMSREEFEARKAELKRRKEREQRFGRYLISHAFMTL